MFKQTAIMLIFLMSGTAIFAQKYKGYSEALVEYYTRDLEKNAKQTANVIRLSSDDLKMIKGSPYINERFILGNLSMGDSLIATEIPMRYNLLSDQIELKDLKSLDNEPSAALLKNPDISIQIYNNIYRYHRDFLADNGVLGSYFEIVWEGNGYSLYKKIDVTYHAPYKATTSFDNDRPAEFTQQEIFYLVNNADEFTELPTRKSALYKVLGDKKKEVKEYIKKNNLEIDEGRDLARLVAYYNSLL